MRFWTATLLAVASLPLAACVTEPAPVDSSPPIVDAYAEFRREGSGDLRERRLEAICFNFPPVEAFTKVCSLLQDLDAERSRNPGAIDGLVRYAGNALFGVFADAVDPKPQELFERAFTAFETSTSPNVRHLGWLLAATGAASFWIELEAARIERVLAALDDPDLLALVFGNLGQCRDRAVVARILRRELRVQRPGSDLRYPGLQNVIAGFDSVLDREAWLRKELPRIPEQHPLRKTYPEVSSVPDSTDEFVGELTGIADDVELTEYDMLLICTFFGKRNAAAIVALHDADVPYTRNATTEQLDAWYSKVRRALREQR
ncbi:MAG: hypothetical protein AB7O52_18250 [Planctomycetota bacterium]